MSSGLLNEIREKARSRVEELQGEIRQARDRLAAAEAELSPLMVIIKVTNPKHTAPSGTSEAVAAAVSVAKGGEGSTVVYNNTTVLPRHPHTGEVLDTGLSETTMQATDAPAPKRRLKITDDVVAAQAVKLPAVKLSARWRGYKLPPRCRLFLDKFGNAKGQITLQQITDWYRTVNPGISEVSQKQFAFSTARILVTKGILHKDAPGAWSLKP